MILSTPTNKIVQHFNDMITEDFPGQTHNHFSAKTIEGSNMI